MAAKVHIASIADYDRKSAIEAFVMSGLDADADIRALLEEARPERLIVVKPNWVQEAHEYDQGVWEPVITHPALLVEILECLARRLRGKATICVCDAPHTYASFEGILTRGDFRDRVSELKQRFPLITFDVLDLRREIWLRKEEVVVERRRNVDDPRGYVSVDLGKQSHFYQHAGEGRYYGADYDSKVVNSHHRGEVQEYLIAGTPMACDLFINVPKLKTHKKTGITCCLKNLVGINGDKNWLPHHTEGSPAELGDEFPELSIKSAVETRAKNLGKNIALNIPLVGTWIYRKMRNTGKQLLGDSEVVVRNGNWSGNDTCWRMALDLNRALLYANLDGTWRDQFRPKRYLAFVDGIVGGQGNGPLCPDPVPSNVLVSGINPAEIDAVVAKLMGFNPHAIPVIERAFEPHLWPITVGRMDEIMVWDGRVGRDLFLPELDPSIEGGFVPHFGWTSLRQGN